MEELVFAPSDFVAVFNQTLSYAYPSVVIEGEISNYRVAKGKWVYFDIKDDFASLKVFGTVFQLTHALEDGMMIRLKARPELHPLYNFSLQMATAVPSGEGSIKKSFDLLFAKLSGEGLFDESRKRNLPYPPEKIGLITSSEAAAYGDFTKVLKARWPLIHIELADVKVQGESSASEIVAALHHFNLQAKPVETIVIIRGGGSAEDLIAFQDENLTRAIAESRIPTLVAIGHERDVSLSELAADVRASTPSNAAELIAPSYTEVLETARVRVAQLTETVSAIIKNQQTNISSERGILIQHVSQIIRSEKLRLSSYQSVLDAYNPSNILKRGFALVRAEDGQLLRSQKDLKTGQTVLVSFHDGDRRTRVIG